MSGRSRAPKRRIVRFARVGAYPDVWWEHDLECGHIERRKRKAAAVKVGCTTCLHRVTDRAAGVEVVPDLERTRLDMEAKVEKAFSLPGWEVESMDVYVRNVDGQAQVARIGVELARSR